VSANLSTDLFHR